MSSDTLAPFNECLWVLWSLPGANHAPDGGHESVCKPFCFESKRAAVARPTL